VGEWAAHDGVAGALAGRRTLLRRPCPSPRPTWRRSSRRCLLASGPWPRRQTGGGAIGTEAEAAAAAVAVAVAGVGVGAAAAVIEAAAAAAAARGAEVAAAGAETAAAVAVRGAEVAAAGVGTAAAAAETGAVRGAEVAAVGVGTAAAEAEIGDADLPCHYTSQWPLSYHLCLSFLQRKMHFALHHAVRSGTDWWDPSTCGKCDARTTGTAMWRAKRTRSRCGGRCRLILERVGENTDVHHVYSADLGDLWGGSCQRC